MSTSPAVLGRETEPKPGRGVSCASQQARLLEARVLFARWQPVGNERQCRIETLLADVRRRLSGSGRPGELPFASGSAVAGEVPVLRINRNGRQTQKEVLRP